MELKDRIMELTQISGISAQENAIKNYLLDELKKLGLCPEVDKNGNVSAKLNSKHKNAKTLLFEAHMDRIGFMVSGIDDAGRLQFTSVGGVDERILQSLEVTVEGDESYYGVVVHPEKKGEDKNPQIEDFRIEIGLTKEEVEKRIPIGAGVSIYSKTESLLGDKLSGAAMDNRAGIAVILDCVERLALRDVPYHISLLFSTGEEIGLQGAYTAHIDADAAIVVDVTHGMTADTKDEVGIFPLGCGTVICRGPNLHFLYTKQLLALAKMKGIPYEIEVASGSSGTTAWAIQTLEQGIPCMLTSIPLRYMHSNMETLSLKDVKATADLLYYAAMGGIELVERTY